MLGQERLGDGTEGDLILRAREAVPLVGEGEQIGDAEIVDDAMRQRPLRPPMESREISTSRDRLQQVASAE
jgi:hypothetical protein